MSANTILGAGMAQDTTGTISVQDQTAQAESGYLQAGTRPYRRANQAMFWGGFATFAMLYGTQPMLPLLSNTFGVAPATASLAVTAGTGALALMLIPASVLSDRFGRERLMKFSLAAAAVIALLSAMVSDFTQLLVLRALLGAVLAGLPAAAMAYLGEEMEPKSLGRAMGLYIGGNALGGMSGRVLAALITDLSSWRVALAVLGILGCLAAVAFWRMLPASRHFRRRAVGVRALLKDVAAIARDPGLPWLFVTAFVLMGAFVGLYNYLAFRLGEAPFFLGQTAVGAFFLLYLVGSWSSAWAGRLADRIGRRNVLWIMVVVTAVGLAITVSDRLILVVAGVALFTFGYFAAHATASGWVGRRAQERRALAAALYLCSYYLGGSLIGSLAGIAWGFERWHGVVGVLAVCVAIAFAVALYLRRVPPLASQAGLTRMSA